MSKIVTIADRNVRPGDLYYPGTRSGGSRCLHHVLKVERVDWEDRIEVKISYLDVSTMKPSIASMTLRPDHKLQVRKGDQVREFMSWEPCYYDSTGRKKPLPAKIRKLFGIR